MFIVATKNETQSFTRYNIIFRLYCPRFDYRVGMITADIFMAKFSITGRGTICDEIFDNVVKKHG